MEFDICLFRVLGVVALWSLLQGCLRMQEEAAEGAAGSADCLPHAAGARAPEAVLTVEFVNAPGPRRI